MKSSVVMATYNGERYIVEQLDSIRNQTIPPDEVIIFDDCSTDSTVKVVHDYVVNKELKNWFVFENKNNRGFFDNFFMALKKSTGDIIYLSDQDDIWDINKIETFTNLYEENSDIVMIQSNFKFVDERGRETKKQENYHGFTQGRYLNLSVADICKYAGSGYTMSFRRSVSDSAFKFQLDELREIFRFHDIVLGLMAVSEGKCLLVRDIVDYHRIHDNNVTKTNNKSHISGRTKEGQIEILTRRIQYFNIIAECTADESKKNVFIEYRNFSSLREKYIKDFQLKSLVKLLEKRKMYESKFGVIADSLYSIGLEKVVCLLMK